MPEDPANTPLSPGTRAAIQRVLDRSATRGEWLISIARFGMTSLSLVRTTAIWSSTGVTGLSAVVAGGACVVSLGFSAFFLARYRSRIAPPSMLAFATVLDAGICFSALSTNVFWPGPNNPGLIRMADLGSPVVPTVAAGLRLSPRIGLLAGVLNLMSLFVLVALDIQRRPVPTTDVVLAVTAHSALLIGATAAAVLMAWRTRRLAFEGALHALSADSAERNLGTLMQDHHDVRTLLSSASLNADLVLRELEPAEGEGTPRPELRETAQQLREDLDRVNDFVAGIRERAYDDLLALEALDETPLGPAIDEAAAAIAQRFPEVAVEVSATGNARILVAGGERAATRIFLNLFANACEGDGRRGARRVRVESREDGIHLEIRVEDDGPGFAIAPGPGLTTKAEGSGLGLSWIDRIATASGGSLEHGARPEGGARVTLRLLRAGGAAPGGSRRPDGAR